MSSFSRIYSVFYILERDSSSRYRDIKKFPQKYLWPACITSFVCKNFLQLKTNYYDIFYPAAAARCEPSMKAAPPAIGFKAENTVLHSGHGARPTGYPSENITPLPTAGERSSAGGPDRRGQEDRRRAHQRHEEPRPFRKSDVHKRLYLVPPFFGTGETIPASKRMPLSISTLKFRACKNCEQGFDNHKRF